MPNKIQDLINDLTFVVADYIQQSVKGLTCNRDQLIARAARDAFTSLEQEVTAHIKNPRHDQLIYLIESTRTLATQLSNQQFDELTQTCRHLLTTITDLLAGKEMKVTLAHGKTTLGSLKRTLTTYSNLLGDLLSEHVSTKHSLNDVVELLTHMKSEFILQQLLEQKEADHLQELLKTQKELFAAQEALLESNKQLTQQTSREQLGKKIVLISNGHLQNKLTQEETTLQQLRAELAATQADLTASFLDNKNLRSDKARLEQKIGELTHLITLYSQHFVAAEASNSFALPRSGEIDQMRNISGIIISSLEKLRTEHPFAKLFETVGSVEFKSSINTTLLNLLSHSRTHKTSKETLRELYGVSSKLASRLHNLETLPRITLIDYLWELFRSDNAGVVPEWISPKNLRAQLKAYSTAVYPESAYDRQIRLFKEIKAHAGPSVSSTASSASIALNPSVADAGSGSGPSCPSN